MSLFNFEKRAYYRDVYRKGLLDDTIPFWFPRTIDQEYGGYFTSLDRDGSLLQSDKSVWFQGRAAWMLANLFNTLEKRAEWIEWAGIGIDFLEKHCFDTDGRMFFSTTREGKPLRKRRYFFSETFAVIAFAAYGAGTSNISYIRKAFQLFEKVLELPNIPGALEPKSDPSIRPMKGLGGPMILIATGQELRKAAKIFIDSQNKISVEDRSFLDNVFEKTNDSIASHIEEIRTDFMKEEFKCLLETVSPDGSFIDTFEGRMINPGHSIESGWFVLEEARIRNNDSNLIELGTKIIDWSWEHGWDRKYGGILYFRDCKGLPCSEYWHDMKFWWPHNEAIIANLLAWIMSGEKKYELRHEQVHEWAYSHFPDPEFGEWFGYLHRDGSLSTKLKGNLWKGPFHLPRMQWYCQERLGEV